MKILSPEDKVIGHDTSDEEIPKHNYLHPILVLGRLVLGRITKPNGSALGRFLKLLVVYPHPLNNFVQSRATSSMNMV